MVDTAGAGHLNYPFRYLTLVKRPGLYYLCFVDEIIAWLTTLQHGTSLRVILKGWEALGLSYLVTSSFLWRQLKGLAEFS